MSVGLAFTGRDESHLFRKRVHNRHIGCGQAVVIVEVNRIGQSIAGTHRVKTVGPGITESPVDDGLAQIQWIIAHIPG